LRLGVYADLVYRHDGETITTDRAFVRFVTGLPPRVDEVVLFGRLDGTAGRSPYELPREGVRLVPLPHYSSVTDVLGLLRSAGGARRVFVRELASLDAVWLFGPHPLSLVFAAEARRRGVPVVLGVRQDFPRYIGNRLPGRGWAWAIPAAHALEQSYRLLARRAPAVVVGEDVARHYRGGRAPVLATGFSLVRAADLVSADEALARAWTGELRVVSVGRLDPEKNPLLLPAILARLRARDPRWRLDVVGDGPLADDVRRRAEELGVAGAVAFHGYVPNGPRLWEMYRASVAFLHVSFTEGLPQVLVEAQGAGLPVVATDVGGVRAALAGGSTGLLVPPDDAEAAATALESLAADEELRRRLVVAGLENAARETLDAQLDRVAAFLREAASSRGTRRP
jgi:glycosyltransferase involved in cell wall biosynthesis